jgi:sensor histidine kinase YesM
MEPHFLFNTLANVLTLIDTDADRARRMLEAFTDYLRSSLGSPRRGDSSVGRELDLAEAYLQLQHLRMDDRLRYSVDADAGLRALALPPLLLQPLVENAVLHGLEPKVDGGTLRVEVRADAAQLVLTVTDDGLGPDHGAGPASRRRAGNGLALRNLRERLRTMYGDAASLRLQPAAPGTRATIRLPRPGSAA